MDAPERLFLDSESQVYRVAGRKLKDSNIEYIRAALLEELCNAIEELLFVIRVHGFAGPKVDAVQAALAAVEG